MKLNDQALTQLANAVIQTEIEAIAGLSASIDARFVTACQVMYDCHGRVVVTGMGKSGHIAGKIAATLASTGTPAFFMHPGEASHGDLGMITAQDVVLAVSNSGETQELLTLLPMIKRLGVQLIALTGFAESTLARTADVHLHIAITQEACPLGLAPTSSTTAALVMGDALAVALLQARGFTEADFALSHPGGSLGRRLLLRVADVMHQGERIPSVPSGASLREALLEMTEKKLGMTLVANARAEVIGMMTDGDLRRMLERNIDVHHTTVDDIMTRSFVYLEDADTLAAEAMHIMEQHKINGLVVLNQQRQALGALNMHDLIQAGIV
ncbi:MAG: KpsF/GutQ family sugar-phosphate isomerase [Methylococcales bacterium]|nr:KpsF/GutQ family sugar-phosphate isomerase [Methylococcales bacterium]